MAAMEFDFTRMSDRELLVKLVTEQEAMKVDIKGLSEQVVGLSGFKEQILGERKVVFALGGIISLLVSSTITILSMLYQTFAARGK